MGTPDPDVDDYIARSERWSEEMVRLRPTLLGCGLDETIKWAKPCYHVDGANIVILQEMKDFLALMFFKGALLDDPDGLLERQGPNSRSARRICFRSVDDVTSRLDALPRYVEAAIAIEEAGLTVPEPTEEPYVEELRERLDANDALAEAFESLTPGRRREYNIYFSGAKQAATRARRVEKYVPKILAGKGFRD